MVPGEGVCGFAGGCGEDGMIEDVVVGWIG